MICSDIFRRLICVFNLGGLVMVFCCGNLIANLNSRSHHSDQHSPVKLISYCIDCPSPEQEGSIAYGLLPRYGTKDYLVSGEVIYCIPNLADTPTLINGHHVRDRIAFVDRGGNSLLEKATKLQAAGAIGIIIADDGQCDEQFFHCGVRAGSAPEGGFAAHDHMNEGWKSITIPVLLVTLNTAEKIRRIMPIEKIEVRGLGKHNMSIVITNGFREEL